MTNFTKLAATTDQDPGRILPAAQAAMNHQLTIMATWICGISAVMLVILWLLHATPSLRRVSEPKPKPEPAPRRAPETKALPAVQILSRTDRKPAADALQRLLSEELATIKRDQVQRICDTIEGVAARFDEIPAGLRAVVTDDGTTPQQDYDTVLDLASNAIDAMTRDEASVEIDQIRTLRLYAQQWEAPSEGLSVGGRGQTGTSGPRETN